LIAHIGSLDLDHIRAKIAEHHGAVGSSESFGEIDYFDVT
jgi:hypothetical protein